MPDSGRRDFAAARDQHSPSCPVDDPLMPTFFSSLDNPITVVSTLLPIDIGQSLQAGVCHHRVASQ
jgi:hypothetical protein